MPASIASVGMSSQSLQPGPHVPLRLRGEGGQGEGPRALSPVRRAGQPEGARGPDHVRPLLVARPEVAGHLHRPGGRLHERDQRLSGARQRAGERGELSGAGRGLGPEDLGDLLSTRHQRRTESTMGLDLLIRNGTIVDGTGGARYRGDVGVQGGRIVEVGRVGAAVAERTIDADGLIVAPGFVDGHTHMDAQVAWDPIGSCSCWHGVTTVITGNCGFALAPCRPEEREWFARCLTAVVAEVLLGPRMVLLGGGAVPAGRGGEVLADSLALLVEPAEVALAGGVAHLRAAGERARRARHVPRIEQAI